MAKIIQTYYISTGALNAMYTLRSQRTMTGGPDMSMWTDHYICNLAATVEKAQDKAREFVDRISARLDSDDYQIIFDDEPDNYANKRRGRLSARETKLIETIESGVFPFGKHAGSKIEDAPSSYILFFADKAKEANDAVMAALSGACQGVALEKGYIAARDMKRAEQREIDEKSNFIGSVGERLVFEGQVVYSFQKESDFGDSYWINKIKVGDDLVVYFGSKSLGEKGSIVKFKGTIVSHDEYNGIKTTKINRPAMVK